MNLIIYGRSESENEQLLSNIEEVLNEISEKPLVMRDCFHIGALKEKESRLGQFIKPKHIQIISFQYHFIGQRRGKC